MFISKIMSQGQKRPQNSSDCSICNLDFKKFRGGPRTPLPMPLASLGSRYRPRNSYLLPHIQGGRSTALCLFLFGTSVYATYKRGRGRFNMPGGLVTTLPVPTNSKPDRPYQPSRPTHCPSGCRISPSNTPLDAHLHLIKKNTKPNVTAFPTVVKI